MEPPELRFINVPLPIRRRCSDEPSSWRRRSLLIQKQRLERRSVIPTAFRLLGCQDQMDARAVAMTITRRRNAVIRRVMANANANGGATGRTVGGASAGWATVGRVRDRKERRERFPLRANMISM